MIVSAPKDENELQHLLFTAIYSGKPFAVRYPRGFGIGVPLDKEFQTLPIGKGEILRRGKSQRLLASLEESPTGRVGYPAGGSGPGGQGRADSRPLSRLPLDKEPHQPADIGR